ncbi:MAG: nicotinate phosphoribosyltransferase [Firmicutes bacterium]|nr:nicotinate phosphoribosyltransferase [Bacillota bacterium]
MYNEKRNLTMLTDLYQLTMMNGYLKHNMDDSEAVFDMFYRPLQNNSVYAVMAGLEQAIEYINNLHFGPEDIEYLRSLNLFDEQFFDYLRSFKFSGDIYAIPEGTPIFPGEPMIRVRAPIMQAQLVETALLNIINHQTLIATKASKVVYAAAGTDVLEFGLRRAQGPDAGIYGARASIIGGCVATSNVYTGQQYALPAKGTHAHSWVMSFPTELDAFRAYAEVYPSSCMLLVDTYNTLKSGVPNAITVFNELKAKGYKPVGIRLDSGDLAYLSKKSRQMLDEAGFPEAKIFVSGDMDEQTIWELRSQGAAIDVWGVGTKMITSDDLPALGGVYKLSAIIKKGVVYPKIKISENPVKMTNPGIKDVYRLYDNATGKAIADYICLSDETIDTTKPMEIFDPQATWKRMTVENFTARPLLKPIFVNGEQVYQSPDLTDIAAYHKEQMNTLWDEYKRLVRPHIYKVDLSQKLYDLKQKLLLEGNCKQQHK